MFLRIFRLLFIILFIPVLALAKPLTIDKEILWQGEVHLDGPVQVSAQGVLRIAAGTKISISDPADKISVQGQLVIDGSQERPVVFATPKGWQGISFVEAAKGSRIVHAQFSDCAQALGIIATSPLIKGNSFLRCDAAIKLLRESNAEIRDNHFVDNGLGLGIEMRSSPKVIGNSFSGHKKSGISASNSSRGLIEDNSFEKNEQGIGILQQYPDLVRNNRFIDNRVGLYCYQTQGTPKIEGNFFQDNEYALVNFSFSFPQVLNNRFVDNKTAVQNDQFGSARVESNLFENNGTAIYNNRKSNPKIHKNRFSGNKLALFIDYSSYPVVKENNFEKTGEGARLGIYQSADWEKRSGSKQLVMKNAQARGSKNSMLGQAPTEFVDVVDLSGNWWGEKTELLKGAEDDENLNFFYDRHDKPLVTYEGFGPGQYRLDKISYQPVLAEPVTGAGPVP